MAEPTSLHPAPTNATPQASSPSPTHYYLARHWCRPSGARNGINLVCRKIKDQRKDRPWDLERRQAQSGDWGRLSGCFSQIKEIREKTDFRWGERVNQRGEGRCREHLSSASVQCKQVMPPCLTSPPPPLFFSMDRFPTFSFFLLEASLNYNDYLYHSLLIVDHKRFT